MDLLKESLAVTHSLLSEILYTLPRDEEKWPLVRNSTVAPIVMIDPSLSVTDCGSSCLGVGLASLEKIDSTLASFPAESMSS